MNEGLKKQKRVEYSTLFLRIIRSLSCQIDWIYILSIITMAIFYIEEIVNHQIYLEENQKGHLLV